MFIKPTRRITMSLIQIRTLAIGIGLACLLSTGSAFGQLGGDGDLGKFPTTFAHEIATSSQDLTNADQVYLMGIDVTAGPGTVIILYTLSAGEFGETPAVPMIGGAGAGTVTLRAGGAGASTVEYGMVVTADLTTPPATQTT